MTARAHEVHLGKLIEDGDQLRDAVHVAVFPATADRDLDPGDHVGIVEGDRVAMTGKRLGIVDPYLRGTVRKGQRFWVFLYPQTITSLRHEWTHPDFERQTVAPQSEVERAKAEIAKIAEEMGGDGDTPEDVEAYGGCYGPYQPMTYERLMGAAEEWIHRGEYEVERGGDNWRDDFPAARFWRLWSIVTGRPVPEGKDENFFSCSC